MVKKEFEIFINPLLQFFGGMAYSILAFLALVKKKSNLCLLQIILTMSWILNMKRAMWSDKVVSSTCLYPLRVNPSLHASGPRMVVTSPIGP